MKLHEHYFPTLFNAKELVSKALHWWVSEIQGLIPTRVVSLFSNPPAQLYLAPSEAQIAATFLTESGDIRLPSLSMAPSSTQAEDFKGILQEKIGRASLQTIIDFDKKDLLVLYADYPITDGKTLHKVLLNDFNRITPFKTDDVYWEWGIHKQYPDRNRLVVKVALVKRTTADRLLSFANDYGLFPVGARLREEGRTSEPFLQLLPRHHAFRGQQSGKSKLLMSAAVILLLFILGSAYAYGTHRQAIQLRAIISEIRPRVEKIEADKERLDALSAIAQELKKREEIPTVLMVLNETTRLIPDDAWLFDFQINSGKVKIAGFSPDPSKLIGVISSSPLFADAKFLAPVTTSPNGAGQRFELSFSLRQVVAP